jgi:hypothetical protein
MTETDSRELFLEFPVIKVRPVAIDKTKKKSTLQTVKPGFFRCPIYGTLDKLRETNKGETEPIAFIELKCSH